MYVQPVNNQGQGCGWLCTAAEGVVLIFGVRWIPNIKRAAVDQLLNEHGAVLHLMAAAA
jgi:hypothetical protein